MQATRNKLREGTPITMAAIAHLIGFVCILDVPELNDTPP
jgi:hypothetical protein